MLDGFSGSMLYYRMLSKKRVIDHFGSPQEVARFFGITDKAVYQWPDKAIPRERELELMLRKPDVFGMQPSSNEEARA